MAVEKQSVYARTLHRASLIVGEAHALARRLDVSLEDLERWMRDEERPPERVFQECVEILLAGPRRREDR